MPSQPPDTPHGSSLASSQDPEMPTRRVNRSCLECTRRKVKCDGRLPCASCVYYRSPDACAYRQRLKRNAVSRSTFDKASEQLRTQSEILDTLFPGIPLSDLKGKGALELLNLLPSTTNPNALAFIHSSRRDSLRISLNQGGAGPEDIVPHQADADDSAAVSENGEPPVVRRWDETHQEPCSVASDDVNAFGLTTDSQIRSYLGMTSMSAIIRGIFRLCPAAKEHTVRCSKAWAAIPSQPLPPVSYLERDRLKEQRCIDFFFDSVHSITPLLDEEDFRRDYLSGARQDASWKGLLNMVFVMGSIASGSDSLHEYYYHQARSFVNLDSLGAGNLDSLHALCLLGGYYLHYRNSPNMAYSVLGAAHRIAIALGLHREPRQKSTGDDPETEAIHQKHIQTRRRTWWSLFCLDTWGAMTHGRPTCGRWDSTTMDTQFPTASSPQDHAIISLQASSSFCLICDRMQQRFARSGRLSLEEVISFDQELVQWYESLPPSITEPSSSRQGFQIAREFMRTRYLNARMLLTRSSFLYVAHGHRKNITELPPEPQKLLDSCCSVASETIDAIALYWTPNRVHVWNAAWYLFQACMTPLLAIAVDKNMETSAIDRVAMCRASLAKALESFAEMRPWMRASDRSPDIVSALYDALTAEYDQALSTPSVTSRSLDMFGWYDDPFNELDWGTFLGGENISFQTVFPTP